jgi:hypothetical protein
MPLLCTSSPGKNKVSAIESLAMAGSGLTKISVRSHRGSPGKRRGGVQELTTG